MIDIYELMDFKVKNTFQSHLFNITCQLHFVVVGHFNIFCMPNKAQFKEVIHIKLLCTWR